MSAIDKSLIADQRKWLHQQIIERGVLAISSAGIATNADKGNAPSRAIAANLAHQLMSEVHERQAG